MSYPDNPHWGPLTGIGFWLFSVALVIFIPLIGVGIYLGIYVAQGNPLPATPPEAEAWSFTEIPALIQVLGNIPAHMITLAICWFIATGRGRVPFKVALGWKWETDGRPIESFLSKFQVALGSKWSSILAKIGYLAAVLVGVIIANWIFSRILPPPQETAFDRLLKVSLSVRISVALMAVLSAPLVEEVIYRGVLFGGLVKKIGGVPTVLVVTMLFAGVHFPQYWQNISGIAGLTFLSLVITTVRAQTKSILPCFLIHLIYNTIGVIQILATGGE